MWDMESTARLLRDMSQSSEPGELVRLFYNLVRRSIDVQRALVVSSVGLSVPQYRLVHNLSAEGDDPGGPVVAIDQIRQGGLLAEILYSGNIRHISHFVPDPSDPAIDLLQGSGCLIALPLFEKGITAGMVVLLGPTPRSYHPAEICALAMASSLLGRAIESQKLASQLENSCQALDLELQAAANVQRWLLPTLPELDNIGIAASYRTARHSGGDYYDVGRLPDGKLGIVIADVSGKGAAAAVLMAVLRSIVHDEVDRARISGPASLLQYADSRLCALRLAERGAFVTAFCAMFDPVSGELTYSCAGHEPARLLRSRERVVIPLDGARTIPLGVFDDPTMHTEATVQLMPDDLVLFFTDGITEARSLDRQFFGSQRLDQLLCDFPEPITADAVVEGIARTVARFEGDAAPADDQTLLALGALKRSWKTPTGQS